MTCREAIREVFKLKDEVLSSADVKQRINAAYPGQWKGNSITADLIGSSVNAPSSRWYPTARKHAFLFSLGDGRYRLWDADTDTGVVGRLDLLAFDKDGSLVVIELKVGKADDSVGGGKPVRGILIAREFSDGAKFAAIALPTLTLKEYRVAFSFNNADLARTPAPPSN